MVNIILSNRTICRALIQREFRLAGSQFQAILNPILFFVIVVTLFPLALSSDNNLLQRIAPGVIWTAALLSNCLGLDRLFRSDYEEGMLEQYLLSPCPLTLLLSIKVFIHWILSNVPLIFVMPLFSLLFHISFAETKVIIFSLLLGTPIISLLGAIVLALTVKLQTHSILLALCVLPLMVPILIFGAGSAVSVSLGLQPTSMLALLGAILILSVTFMPLVIGSALRIGVE